MMAAAAAVVEAAVVEVAAVKWNGRAIRAIALADKAELAVER